jgi:hypothetical protein
LKVSEIILNLFRLSGRSIAFNDLAILINKKLLEIPFNILRKDSALLLLQNANRGSAFAPFTSIFAYMGKDTP